MSIQHLTALGAGVLGAQIAFQAAFHGVKVVSYDINDEALTAAKTRFEALSHHYRRDLGADDAAIEQAFERLSQSSDLQQAVKNADIIIEAVPEKLSLKQQVWQSVGQLAKKDCIFATNTSTILPSKFSQSSGDVSRFLAMHFGNDIWKQNVVEIMGTKDTHQAIIDQTIAFGEQMGMVPVLVKKEQSTWRIKQTNKNQSLRLVF
ncbi:3-hydroxyacyl-CoA dehydrogenase NAD-binding domain-containing protein [Moraxella ovis]|uniref:3-hydroxyacyl-CoA dehydrogenase NAD-binding domain-containing protein n=1 Tax=Moraxella ovis TaxID=29433 RepID=UPI000D9F18B3|nr:3-hydroxyacyl-CoA dehydrogenase NAD-binding domain-containing protein [Moraxella ovis]SPX85918.1 Probable 3-hydroxybutyryl-CoA dehydrogenase [Moraxella ovis]STZ06864.1 Probable 3-hydroxybutyryl-CoA dehydrogenase [Moraxella ovis]